MGLEDVSAIAPVPPVLNTPADLESVDARESLNSDLAEVLADATLSPESAWARVREVLRGHGYDLPFALMDIQDTDGEDVYGLTDTVFVYFAFFQLESGWYDCYAEALTEAELQALMEESDSGE
jgi:hypothetical protein